jgi:zinc transport system substrate-binding protein
MKIKRVAVVIIILLISALILGYLAQQKNISKTESGKIGVAVSLGPEVEWVNAVGGSKVDVTLMVPAGSDPHTYEPLPNQLAQVSNAKIYVEMGSSVEFENNYMDKIRETNPNMLVINASQGVELIPNSAENESETVDPHVWADPKNAKIMVNNIYQGLVEVDPADKDYFTKNRDTYLQQLDELDKNTTALLKDKNNTYILVLHPAFGYLAKDYNITQIGAMINDEEPSPQRIALMINIAKEYNITTVYSEPQYDPRFMQSIASQIGGNLVTVNDLDENYLENMKNITVAFSKTG